MVDEHVRRRRATSRGSTRGGFSSNEHRVSIWVLVTLIVVVFVLGIYVGRAT